jgi:hypothetical protein
MLVLNGTAGPANGFLYLRFLITYLHIKKMAEPYSKLGAMHYQRVCGAGSQAHI